MLLKLCFGDGSVLQQEITKLYVPEVSVSNMGGQLYNEYDCLADGVFINNIFDDNMLHLSSAELSNGYLYSFSEAYKVELDYETNTISIFLWRDEAYELESQLFD